VSDRGRQAVLDLDLAPDEVGGLARSAALSHLRAGRQRSTPVRLVWHDTPDAALATDGIELCEHRLGRETVWRLARMRGEPAAPLTPGAPPLLLEEAADPTSFTRPLPAPLLPVAACEGVVRTLPLAEAAGSLRVTVLDGILRAVAGERAVCRVTVAGEAEAGMALALGLAAGVRLCVPAAPLAAQAYALAGRILPPAATGAPALPVDASVGDAFAGIAAHLGAVLLHWAALARVDGGPEAVHQMRVAVRRLRSAVSLFRRAVGGPALEVVEAEQQALMRVLGPARDWDVFAAGTGRAVARAFPGDPAILRLVAATERRRRDCYASLDSFLDGATFRALGIRLAGLLAARPWELPPAIDGDDAGQREAADRQAAALAAPLRQFATHALTRRLARVSEVGGDLSALPAEDLHRARIQIKRLRYAAEFFAPLYPPRETRRFIRRLSALQEQLGLLNDGAVAQHLMAQLPGGERSYGAGVVRGFVAAGLRGARAKAERSWRKARRLEPFWS
jgi:CHAD domain-containing protein